MYKEIKDLPLDELRVLWAQAWGKQPHGTMGRTMMFESLKFKRHENGGGKLPSEQQARLDELIRTYRRNPKSLDKTLQLKPGTRLVRTWKGKKYFVTVAQSGFEYEGDTYTSLSHIANTITGSRWNGWLFFGLK